MTLTAAFYLFIYNSTVDMEKKHYVELCYDFSLPI